MMRVVIAGSRHVVVAVVDYVELLGPLSFGWKAEAARRGLGGMRTRWLGEMREVMDYRG